QEKEVASHDLLAFTMMLDQIARQVLRQFLDATTASPVPLGNCGGFSGASIWRVPGINGPLCLKAWPGAYSPRHLARIHDFMIRAGSLRFVPRISKTAASADSVDQAGRLWDLTTWMPGRADFAAMPTTIRVSHAAQALALLHQTWGGK